MKSVAQSLLSRLGAQVAFIVLTALLIYITAEIVGRSIQPDDTATYAYYLIQIMPIDISKRGLSLLLLAIASSWGYWLVIRGQAYQRWYDNIERYLLVPLALVGAIVYRVYDPTSEYVFLDHIMGVLAYAGVTIIVLFYLTILGILICIISSQVMQDRLEQSILIQQVRMLILIALGTLMITLLIDVGISHITNTWAPVLQLITIWLVSVCIWCIWRITPIYKREILPCALERHTYLLQRKWPREFRSGEYWQLPKYKQISVLGQGVGTLCYILPMILFIGKIVSIGLLCYSRSGILEYVYQTYYADQIILYIISIILIILCLPV